MCVCVRVCAAAIWRPHVICMTISSLLTSQYQHAIAKRIEPIAAFNSLAVRAHRQLVTCPMQTHLICKYLNRCCGLILTTDSRFTMVVPSPNIASTKEPLSFFV